MNETDCTETQDCGGTVRWGTGVGYLTDNRQTRVSSCSTCRRSHRRPVDTSAAVSGRRGPGINVFNYHLMTPRLTQIMDERSSRR